MKLIGRTGAVTGRDAIIGVSMRIGAAADNDFRVEVTGISRHHARIVRDGEDYWLEDSGSTNGTFVNGLRIARERLRHLDVITLGRGVDLIAVASEQAPATAAHLVKDAWLDPMDAQVGSRIDIPPGELTLGRSAPSNVLLDSPLVSHLHAKLERTPDHVIVSDLASSNGTFVNGRLIREPVELVDGDVLSIAASRQFRVNIQGSARRDAASKPDTTKGQVFDSEWKTRLVWSADELVELEADRQRVLAQWKKAQAAAGEKQPEAPEPPAPKPVTPPAPKPVTPPAPKPVAPPAPAPSPAPKPPVPPPAPKPVADPPPPKPAPPPPPPKPVVAKPPAPTPEPAETKAIRSVVLKGQSNTFRLGPGRHDVGRSDGIAMTLLSPQVSRHHAVIVVTAGEVRVEDAKSANGTVLNGARVATGGTAVLKTGDRLAFGNLEFIVELVS